ncbi:MAG: FAD-dependent monooxygenase [Pseudomonadota bacterium]|jgi:2-polyprenyl-6-methoxyphenol hydroxylase-like FAD-dependent oxidoreductase
MVQDNGVRNELGVLSVDVAIVGGGMAGAVAAHILTRKGVSTAVIDLRAQYPSAFRCEKLTADQLELLDSLQLGDVVRAIGAPYASVDMAVGAKVADRRPVAELGVRYETMVNAVREALPKEANFIVARVDELRAGPDRQSVLLADGRRIDARLIVLATGGAEKLRAGLGVRRKLLRPAHSVCVGVSLARTDGYDFPFEAMIHQGARVGEGVAFASLFPMEGALRVNLFSFRGLDDPRIVAVRKDPLAGLAALAPGLLDLVGPVESLRAAELHLVDLYEVEGQVRDGAVLVGDAFRASCPSTGTGVTRLLTDVSQLCELHIPEWLATPGMAAEKIARYYADPVKQACDANAARMAESQRDTGLALSFMAKVKRHARLARTTLSGMAAGRRPAAYPLKKSA